MIQATDFKQSIEKIVWKVRQSDVRSKKTYEYGQGCDSVGTCDKNL